MFLLRALTCGKRSQTWRLMAHGAGKAAEGHQLASWHSPSPHPGGLGGALPANALFCSAGCYSRRPLILTDPTKQRLPFFLGPGLLIEV